jgi:hypothetical protein
LENYFLFRNFPILDRFSLGRFWADDLRPF